MKKMIAFSSSIVALFSLAIPMFIPVAAQAQMVSTTTGSCYTFTHNLGEGRSITAAEGVALAADLSAAGVWNSGTPITSYTDAVASAVSGFQEKYAAQILTPNGLTYGTGYVGASTRAELNSLYGCSTTNTATTNGQTFQCPVGWTCSAPAQQTPVTYTCPIGWTCTPAVTTTAPTNTNTNSGSCSVGDYSYCLTNTAPSLYSPVLYSISPSIVSAGQIVTLYGNNFSGSSDINISGANNVDLSFAPSSVSPSGTSLTFFVPSSLAQGSYAVSIYNITSSNETSNSLNFTIGAGSVVTNPITNSGTSGTISVTQGSIPTSVANAGQINVPILDVRVQAQNSDASVQTLQLDLGPSTNIYNYIYSSLSLVDSSTGTVLATVPLNPSTVVQNGSNYAVILSGFNFVVPNGTYKDLVVKANLFSQINTQYDGSWSIGVGSLGLRAVNSAGVNVYGPTGQGTVTSTNLNADPISQTMVIGAGSMSTTNSDSATLSLDGSSPQSNSVTVTNTTQGQYLGLPVLVFDLNARGDNLHLHSMTVNVSGSGAGTLSAAYLYQGSYPVASASIVNGVATFANITDNTLGASIPVNTTLPYTIKVDVTGINSGAQGIVTASVQSAVVYNSTDSLVSVNGTALGNPITITN